MHRKNIVAHPGGSSRILLLYIIVAAIFLAGCSKDDDPRTKANPACFSDNKITISDILDIPENVVFDKVRIKVCGLEWAIIDVVEARYENNKFVIELPDSYPADKLCKVSRENASDYEGFWPALADNLDARVAGFENESIEVYNGNEKVGMVYLSDWDGASSVESKTFILYHYTNEPFSLSGTNYTVDGNRASYRYYLSFRKGWNAYARISSEESASVCTTDISRELLTRWRFKSY